MPKLKKSDRLKKELGLSDVFAISTGALFSSGFFLLPGLAVAKAGPSAILAYLFAGILIIPAMLSAAELSTAMPRAGGAYYFIDRSLGPAAGAIGGVGTWLALVLKSAFALIGMGAYMMIFVHLPIETVAVGLTLLFVVLNIMGAKETTGLQKVLVFGLIMILGFFVVQGVHEIFTIGVKEVVDKKLTPVAPFGIQGLLSTIGLVFVSYAGLTAVTSVSEEVKRPDRNIPRGMILSLFVATIVHVIGVLIMVAVLDMETLASDLTPVATAAQSFFEWLPGSLGIIMIVVAGIAAFASTANAGVMAASRYLLAMARDRLLWKRFANLGRFQTPTLAVIATGGAMMFIVLALDVEAVAKLASTFQLFLFTFLNLVVIVMRESRIESYDPGYRSPGYPWIQLAGILVYISLIVLMGWLPILLTVGMIVVVAIWYIIYIRPDVVRAGAIYHVFERLGRQRFVGLERELREIIKEKGLREKDPYDAVVARAQAIDVQETAKLSNLVERASALLKHRLPVESDNLPGSFLEGIESGLIPVEYGAVLLHARIPGLKTSELVLVRTQRGLVWDAPQPPPGQENLHAVFFLISGVENPGLHLRILGALAERIEDDEFLPAWLAADGEEGLKSTLLRLDRVLTFRITEGTPTESLIGRALREIPMEGNLVALIQRHDDTIVPRGRTVLRDGDHLTVIGEPEKLKKMAQQYGVSGLHPHGKGVEK